MANGLPSALWGAGTRRALLICIVLLLLSSWQGTSGPTGSRMLFGVMASQGSPPTVLRSGPAGGPALRRAARMTPFWRMVGSKPLGAYCRHGLECSTKMCRNGHCAPPQYEC
ncbi:liver-expressed antimicrobial peptide 2 [Emydura macquarii macquarii]|uniref:liver-expressed antimicrobial peptide 2 n=1 Tax=Emydura macquarii macquarii TaxID=1129001 RepID=UPI00352A31F3